MRKKLFILPVIFLLVIGCSAASWFQVIGDLLPLAAQIATQFYAYSNKGTVDADDQKLIAEYTASAQNILQTISNAVRAINDPADTSAIQKVNALLKQLQNDSNTLLAALHVKDANTLAFINALLADAADLASLVPVPASPGPVHTASVQVQIRQSLPKASVLKNVFQSRLDNLPK